MPEFDKLRFLELLREAPERKELLEEPQHSEYLQTQVFDKLKANGVLDISTLDMGAVSLRDLVETGYPAMYENVFNGWSQGVNSFLKKTPAAHLKQRSFF